MDAKDAAGMTRSEVAGLSLEEEFGLVGQRYARVQELLEEAQRRISDGVWFWNGGETIPHGGGGQGYAGATDKNSYYLRGDRIILPEGATGAESDLDPMLEFFKEKGWESSIEEMSGRYYLNGKGGDGWKIEYAVRESGQYSLTVDCGVFWTNNYGELLAAVSDRDSDDFPDESLPGVFVPFPRWDDPVEDDGGF